MEDSGATQDVDYALLFFSLLAERLCEDAPSEIPVVKPARRGKGLGWS